MALEYRVPAFIYHHEHYTNNYELPTSRVNKLYLKDVIPGPVNYALYGLRKFAIEEDGSLKLEGVSF